MVLRSKLVLRWLLVYSLNSFYKQAGTAVGYMLIYRGIAWSNGLHTFKFLYSDRIQEYMCPSFLSSCTPLFLRIKAKACTSCFKHSLNTPENILHRSISSASSHATQADRLSFL